MRIQWWNLLLLSLGLGLMGCPSGTSGDDDDSSGDDDDDDDSVNCASILSTTPEPGDSDVFTNSVSVSWDAAPDTGNVAVADSAGAAVTGTISEDDNGRTLVFEAGDNFAASTTFTVTVSQACADDVTFDFTTGPYGDPVTNEDDIIGRAYNLDLGSATFVEPAGVGALLQGFLVDVYVIFNATADSDLAAGEMHIVGAVGELDGADIVQDTCNETLPFTLGPDEILGTGDDTPAEWSNPDMALEADALELSVQGVNATIQDLEITAKFHPELTGFVGGKFAGSIDTRALVGLLDSTDPNAICDLVEKTVGISCEDCGGGENYCLGVVAEDVSGDYLDNIAGGLTPRSCVDVLEDNACMDGWGDYDEDGDGTYELCPDFNPPVND